MKVLKFDKVSVLVQTEIGNIWVDYEIDKDGSLEMDWNKYIFYKDNSEDMLIKDFQEDANNYMEVFSCVEQMLLNEGILCFNDEDKYSYTDEWEAISEMQIL